MNYMLTLNVTLKLTLIMAAAQNKDGAGGKISEGSLIVIVFTRTTGWISI